MLHLHAKRAVLHMVHHHSESGYSTSFVGILSSVVCGLTSSRLQQTTHWRQSRSVYDLVLGSSRAHARRHINHLRKRSRSYAADCVVTLEIEIDNLENRMLTVHMQTQQIDSWTLSALILAICLSTPSARSADYRPLSA